MGPRPSHLTARLSTSTRIAPVVSEATIFNSQREQNCTRNQSRTMAVIRATMTTVITIDDDSGLTKWCSPRSLLRRESENEKAKTPQPTFVGFDHWNHSSWLRASSCAGNHHHRGGQRYARL